jgi:hypothetical protein
MIEHMVEVLGKRSHQPQKIVLFGSCQPGASSSGVHAPDADEEGLASISFHLTTLAHRVLHKHCQQ